MSYLNLRAQKNIPPQGALEINWNSPFAHELLAFVPLTQPGNYINLVDRRGPAAMTAPNLDRWIKGPHENRLGGHRIGTRFVKESSHYLRFDLPKIITVPCSISIGYVNGALSSSSELINVGPHTGADYACCHIYTSSGQQLRATIAATTGASPTGSQAAGDTPIAGESSRCLATFIDLANWTMMMEGKPITTKNLTGKTLPSLDSLWIGAKYISGAPGTFITGAFEYGAAWSRAIPEGESSAFLENPWAIVKPTFSRKYFFFDTSTAPSSRRRYIFCG